MTEAWVSHLETARGWRLEVIERPAAAPYPYEWVLTSPGGERHLDPTSWRDAGAALRAGRLALAALEKRST